METKDNTGVLFKNEKREGRQDPDYRGSALVDGKEYWLSAWINTAKKDNSKYMAIKLKAKEEARAPVQNEFEKRYPPTEAAPKTTQAPPPESDFNDDIPF
jgi:uncharacterized protein (DUF736 family)